MFEAVLSLVPGEIDVDVLRHALGPAIFTKDQVEVVVLGGPGQVLVRAQIGLMDVQGGPGRHRAMCCPACQGPARCLVASDDGLMCRSCTGGLTVHQRLKNTVDYRDRGGRQLDRLLALTTRRGGRPVDIEEAWRLAREIEAIHRTAVEGLSRKTRAAIPEGDFNGAGCR